MAAVKPLYVDSNNDLCQMLSGDFLDITQGGTGATTQAGAVANLGLTIGSNTQAWDADLDAVAALATTGMAVRTGSGTWATRTMTAPAAGITITNPDGVSGSPTFALANDLAALEALAGTGIAVRTATDTWVQRQIAVANTGRLTVATADGVSGNPTLDLATLTDSGTGTFLKLTRDAYGRVSGTTAVVAGDISGLVDTRYAQLSGATFTGTVTLNADPVSNLQAATKQYVDSNIQGLTPKPTARLATTAALPTNTYSNGASGVGATLTASANGALTVDSVAAAVGDVILVKNEATAANNGLYVVTAAGGAGAAYVLTRHVDMDSAAEMTGAFVPVGSAGTTNANSLWLGNPGSSVTVGTTAIPFTQLNKGTDLSAGNGISITGNVVAVTTVSSSRISVTGGGIDLASGVIATPGTYTKLTVDTYGRVTAGASATAADVGAQASSASLTALAALAGSGLIVQTGANTFAERSLTAPAAGLTITNPDGVSGSPTFALANDLAALEALNTNGIPARTGTDTWAARTMTGTAGRITVTNGDGIAGNPTFDLVSGVISSPGTYNSVTVDTYGRVTAGSTVATTTAVTQVTLQNNQGSTISIGQAVYTDASGTVKLAQGNASGTRLVQGLVLDTTIANAASGLIGTKGVVTATTTQWNAVTGGSGGLTAGAKYYLSNSTAGGLTTTAPTTGWLVYVGKALSTTQLEVGVQTPIRLS